jgi:hypothetical protein
MAYIKKEFNNSPFMMSEEQNERYNDYIEKHKPKKEDKKKMYREMVKELNRKPKKTHNLDKY